MMNFLDELSENKEAKKVSRALKRARQTLNFNAVVDPASLSNLKPGKSYKTFFKQFLPDHPLSQKCIPGEDLTDFPCDETNFFDTSVANRNYCAKMRKAAQDLNILQEYVYLLRPKLAKRSCLATTLRLKITFLK